MVSLLELRHLAFCFKPHSLNTRGVSFIHKALFICCKQILKQSITCVLQNSQRVRTASYLLTSFSCWFIMKNSGHQLNSFLIFFWWDVTHYNSNFPQVSTYSVQATSSSTPAGGSFLEGMKGLKRGNKSKTTRMSLKDHYDLEKLQSTKFSGVILIFHNCASAVACLRIMPK